MVKFDHRVRSVFASLAHSDLPTSQGLCQVLELVLHKLLVVVRGALVTWLRILSAKLILRLGLRLVNSVPLMIIMVVMHDVDVGLHSEVCLHRQVVRKLHFRVDRR